jgi:hypothetical protein
VPSCLGCVLVQRRCSLVWVFYGVVFRLVHSPLGLHLVLSAPTGSFLVAVLCRLFVVLWRLLLGLRGGLRVPCVSAFLGAGASLHACRCVLCVVCTLRAKSFLKATVDSTGTSQTARLPCSREAEVPLHAYRPRIASFRPKGRVAPPNEPISLQYYIRSPDWQNS